MGEVERISADLDTSMFCTGVVDELGQIIHS